jgi:DNA-binding CsgD family transcriptional regulator/predicted enzyme related to lactoylglutathione lyase
MTKTKRGRPPHDDVLTPAEWRVVFAVQHGLNNQQCAAHLQVSVDAIKYHLRNILSKLDIPNKKTLQRTLIKSTLPKTATLSTAQEHPMSPTTDILGLGQIARTVSNCEQSRNWYELVLELPHLYTFGTLSFFNINGTRLMLSQQEQLNANESILYFKVVDIEAKVSQLQAKGVEMISAPHRIHTHADGTEEWMAFFKDPDGRPLALMSHRK